MTAVTISSSMPQYPRGMTKGTSRPSVVRHEPMGSGLPAASLPWLVLASMHRRALQVLILILAPRLFRSVIFCRRLHVTSGVGCTRCLQGRRIERPCRSWGVRLPRERSDAWQMPGRTHHGNLLVDHRNLRRFLLRRAVYMTSEHSRPLAAFRGQDF